MVSIKAPCPGVIDGENEGEVIADLELLYFVFTAVVRGTVA